MSKRSQTSRASSSGEGSSRPRRRGRAVRQPDPIPEIEEEEPIFYTEFLGLQNLDETAQGRWRNLVQPGRTIQSTRFCDLQTLNNIGLEESVRTLMRKVGLEGFLDKNAPTYIRMTLEFLATFRRGKDTRTGEAAIVFNLHDHSHIMTMTQLREAFGIINVHDEDYGGFEKVAFWQLISHSIWEARLKLSSIPHPALRYTIRLLASTFLAQGEATNLGNDQLKILWSLSPEGRGCPDWLDFWLCRCTELGAVTKGKISIGGMISIIASYLDVEIPIEENGEPILKPVKGSYLFDKKGMIATDMLMKDEIRNPNYFVWQWNGVPYMRLPQPRTLITPQTPNSELFLEPDEIYRMGVQDVQAQEQAHLPGVPPPPPRPDYYVDLERRVTNIENNQYELSDNMYYVTSMMANLNSFYATHYPDYIDPTQNIHDEIARRRANRPPRNGGGQQ